MSSFKTLTQDEAIRLFPTEDFLNCNIFYRLLDSRDIHAIIAFDTARNTFKVVNSDNFNEWDVENLVYSLIDKHLRLEEDVETSEDRKLRLSALYGGDTGVSKLLLVGKNLKILLWVLAILSIAIFGTVLVILKRIV